MYQDGLGTCCLQSSAEKATALLEGSKLTRSQQRGQQPPGLHCQQVEGGGGSSLPSSGTGEARTDWSESGEGL